jgi:multidrug efflux pump subunit AcrB
VGGLCFATVGSGFIPKIDEGGFILDYIAPPGMSLTETDRLMRQIEAVVRATPDVDTYSRRTGAQLGGGLTEPNTGDFFIRLKTKGRRPIEEVMTEVAGKVQASVPGVEIETAQLMADLIGDLTAVPQPIEVKLYSDDAALLQKTGPAIAELVGKVQGVTEMKSGVVIAGDGLQIDVDPVRAELEGIDAGEASKQLEGLLSGNVATQIQTGANLANVRIWTPQAARARIDQMGALMLKSPADQHLFPLSRIANIHVVTGQAEIGRENMRRMDAVTARVVGRDTGSAAKEVRQAVARPGVLPAGVTFEMGGLDAEQQSAFRGMALVFAAAVAAVFVLLLIIYESFRTAFSILLMPLAAASAVAIGLWLTGVELNIMALMGTTMILGITTEVAIFYFTEYEALLEEGLEPDRALVEAGLNRLRRDDHTCRNPGSGSAGPGSGRQRLDGAAAGHRHHLRPDRPGSAGAARDAGRLQAAGRRKARLRRLSCARPPTGPPGVASRQNHMVPVRASASSCTSTRLSRPILAIRPARDLARCSATRRAAVNHGAWSRWTKSWRESA